MGPIQRITLQSETQGIAFFPGLAAPVVIDPALLDGEEAARLQVLAEKARFFDLPREVGTPAPGAADYRSEVLSIDDGTTTHTVRALIPIADPALKELFDAVQAHAKAIRAAGRR